MSSEDPFAKFASDMAAIPGDRIPMTAATIQEEMTKRYAEFFAGIAKFHDMASKRSEAFMVQCMIADCDAEHMVARAVVAAYVANQPRFSTEVFFTKSGFYFQSGHSEFAAAAYAHDQNRFTQEQQGEAVSLIRPFISRALA